MRGGPLKNRQLVAFDGQSVTCSYHDHRALASDGSSTRHMRLPAEQFIGRVLQHVLPVRTQVVRCDGLYHASQADALAQMRAELGQASEVRDETPSWQALCARQGDGHPERCPVCG